MAGEVRRVIEHRSGRYPHLYNANYAYYIRCYEHVVPWFRWRVATVVVVDTRLLADHLQLGVKTAYQTSEFF